MNDSTLIPPGSVLDVFLTDYPELVKPLMDEVVKTSIALGRGEGVVIVLWRDSGDFDVMGKNAFLEYVAHVALRICPDMTVIADAVRDSNSTTYLAEFHGDRAAVSVFGDEDSAAPALNQNP